VVLCLTWGARFVFIALSCSVVVVLCFGCTYLFGCVVVPRRSVGDVILDLACVLWRTHLRDARKYDTIKNFPKGRRVCSVYAFLLKFKFTIIRIHKTLTSWFTLQMGITLLVLSRNCFTIKNTCMLYLKKHNFSLSAAETELVEAYSHGNPLLCRLCTRRCLLLLLLLLLLCT
jgi:hypothetical protein